MQIKRPYFHVKPLDRHQLRAWHSYLDWEIAQLNKDPQESSKQGVASYLRSQFKVYIVCLLFFFMSNVSGNVCSFLDVNEAATEGLEVTSQSEEKSEVTVVAHDDTRVRILFERCLIACALYEEFWTRVRF